jgi:ATPase subunit of ABC transporter with duplicated ATPase domains
MPMKLQIYIPPGPRLGDVVIEAQNVAKSYEGKLLYDNLSFTMPKGSIVGIVGPNGAGKTTLFRMITGQEKPDAGTFKVGETVKLAYVDQARKDIDPNKTVFEEISKGEDMITLGVRCRLVPMLRGLTFPATLNKRKLVCFQVVKEIAFIWPKCFKRVQTYCFLMNQRMILM